MERGSEGGADKRGREEGKTYVHTYHIQTYIYIFLLLPLKIEAMPLNLPCKQFFNRLYYFTFVDHDRIVVT